MLRSEIGTLFTLPLDGPGRVLMTHPGAASRAAPPLSIGAALGAALAGRTEDFAMIVGYFGHGGQSTRVTAPHDLHDPVALLLAELAETPDRDDSGQPRARFHLLFGGIASRASALALELWWWLCRWHVSLPRAADAWRERALADLPGERGPLLDRVHALFLSGSGLGLPLLDATHADAKALLDHANTEESAALAKLQATFGQVAWGREAPSPLSVQVGSLLLYLLQRHAEVRYGAHQEAGQTLRIFHPKLYVVERGARPGEESDAFVFAGSANWSAVALDSTGDANVEVATIHRVAGAPFTIPRPGSSLGADLAATARALVDAAPVFARWLDKGDGLANVCEIGKVAGLLEMPAHLAARATTYEVEREGSSIAAEGDESATSMLPLSSADQRRFAQAICRDIEIALGLDARTLDATIHTLHGLERAWHGKRPSTYQLDGAARLLALLQHSRGAMLTDEPGLGKTLVAQLVAAALIRDRLVARRKLAGDMKVGIESLPRVRVSILAPARVLGRGGRSEQAATQWFRHALEIRSAVSSALANEPELRALAENPGYLDIRLFSNQSLSRALLDKQAGALRDEVAEDLDHLACSEIVIVDEAHNFRNGGGRATRLLRLCLSLPVWGEADWCVSQSAGELHGDATPAIPDAPASATGRKIVLLSATPFNNRIQDVSTQLGHFAKAQEWTNPAPDLLDTLGRRVRAVPSDPTYWTGALATKKHPTARGDFDRILEAVAVKHIGGGRALDPDDVKALQRQIKDDESAKARDGGPTYRWTGLHAGLGRIFYAIGQQLEQEREGHGTTPGLIHDTRARIDAMLLGYVVQRSRRQVLDFVDRHEGPQACAAMFRAPKQPRAPLPIRMSAAESDHETQEREILDALFVLLDKDGPDASSKGSSARLNMLAYELRYLRGFDRGTGTGARSLGASNFVAFQSVNLVKRLQSCSYAFLMTLVRGLLRTNLYELALVEALVEAMAKPRPDKKDQQVLGLAEDRSMQLARAREGCERAAAALFERIEEGSNLEQLRRLLGQTQGKPKRGKGKGGSISSFAELIGLGPEGTDADARVRLAEDVELAIDYLHVGLKDRKKGKKPKPNPDAPVSHWVDRLLEDLASKRSQIADDAARCLDWVFDQREGLVRIVYSGLERRSGESMASLVDLARTSDDLTDWLINRIEADRRAADLIAFLLAQTAVRMAAERDPSLREHAPGGDRSLMFSEYADTIDYLRALLTALHRACSRLSALKVNERRRVRGMLDNLRARVVPICESLAAATRKTLASLHKTDAGLFPPPLDPQCVGNLIPNADELARVAIELVEHAAIVTSRVAGGERLVATESDAAEQTNIMGAADATYETDDTLDLEAGSGSTVDDAPALDAFSPWYQVDATSVGQGEAVARRLANAQRRPLYTLLATEVLAEGVNLQECGVAIHYDLPWNPTRLIQRNGRVDRRIDPRVEQASERRVLAQQLVDAAAHRKVTLEIDADRFWAPSNVYHLTVPPIEPKLDDVRRTALIKRVRQVLFDKLSGIRRLFGLSAWPVVLGIDDAANVLDGSLAYETAAFRRREELFLHWRTLRDRLPLAEGETLPSHGAFVVALGAERLAQLHFQLADAHEGEALRTDRLRSLLVSIWSRSYPRSIPLRSGIDVSPFMVADDAIREALEARWRVPVDHTGGVLALVQTPDEVIAWRIRSETLPTTRGSRTVLGACFVAPDRTKVLAMEPDVDWSSLAHASENGEEPRGPTSPTAMVEIVLDVLAGMVLGGEAPRVLELASAQALPLDWVELAQDRRLGLLLRRPLDQVSNNFVAVPAESEPDGFNLVVVE
ncbi:helicase-related protein [Nannocystaceae bacterium ST9]